ncbi:MAG: pyridoxal phosphate-dependent aminotransferase, partial [Acidimicrobiales bacterium]
MLAAVTRHTTCVIVSNPNNPTGGAVGQEALTELASDLSDEILLIVDEAYFEYTDEFAEGGRGALKLFELGRPLIVTRTFSKFFGLAGVRLGYAVTSDAELCRELRGHVGPLSVSGLALAAGQAALFAEDEYLERLIKQKEQRSRLWSALDEMGLCPLPTQTNFVYCGEPHPSVADWLAERHLSIRAGSTIGSPGHMRITVGRPEDNELVVSLLRQWLADFGRNWIR